MNRDALARVNEARRVVKHKSIEITAAEVERCIERSRTFLEQNGPIVFRIDLFAARLSDRIADDKVRAAVQAAEAALDVGNLPESVKQSAIAFDQLKRPHALVSRAPSHPNSDRMAAAIARDAAALETKVNLAAIGVDYGRFMQFQSLVPIVQTAISGKQTFVFPAVTLTPDRCAFCIHFVVDVATGIEMSKLV